MTLEGFEKITAGTPEPEWEAHCGVCGAVARYCPGHAFDLEWERRRDGPMLAPAPGIVVRGNRERPASISYGFFRGEPVARWTPDGERMILMEDFTYVDRSMKEWKATKGSTLDGASIPRGFWTLVGSPYRGRYRYASIVHDYHCVARVETWEDVHLMFYRACMAGGCGQAQAKILYYAVYHFGPRWRIYQQSGSQSATGPRNMALSSPDDGRCVERVERFILSRDPSLEDMRKTNPYALGFPRITSKRR